MARPNVTVLHPEAGPGALGFHWHGGALAQHDPGVLVHVFGDLEDAPRLAPVAWSLAGTGAFDQTVVDATPSGDAGAALAALGVTAPVRRLKAPGRSPAQRVGTLLAGFNALIAESAPLAVVVHAEDDAAMTAGVAAARAGVPLLRIVGARAPDGAGAVKGGLLERLAELIFVPDDEEADRIVAARVDPARVNVVGSPLIDAVHRSARAAAARRACDLHRTDPGAYVLAVITRPDAPIRACGPLAALARSTPLLLELSPTVAHGWENTGALGVLTRAGARIVRPGSFVDRLSLERTAGAIVTDSARVEEEASALGVPCSFIVAAGRRTPVADRGTTLIGDEELSGLAAIRPKPSPPTPSARRHCDGRAAPRIADVLIANFTRVSLRRA